MPTISIIVPVFNAAKNLRRCIDSILSQSFTDLEVLLIDDGSKDNSLAICNEYATNDKRVLVFHKENGGVSSARNIGIDNARGEWICFVDSDDYIGNKSFEYVLAYRPYDLITWSFKEFGEKSLINGSKETCIHKLPEDAFHVLNFSPNDKTMTPYLMCWSHFFKKSIIDTYQLRFDPITRFGEDTLFVIKYLMHCQKIILLPEVLYFYRIEDGAFQSKYKLSAEETNAHCNVLTAAMEEYCATFGCPMPQLYYSNFVTYLKAFTNYLNSTQNFKDYAKALATLHIPYEKLRYAGRKYPIQFYLKRCFPRLSYIISEKNRTGLAII